MQTLADTLKLWIVNASSDELKTKLKDYELRMGANWSGRDQEALSMLMADIRRELTKRGEALPE